MASLVSASSLRQRLNGDNHTFYTTEDDSRLGLNGSTDSDSDSSAFTTPDRNPAGLAHIRALQETCINISPQDHHKRGSPKRQSSVCLQEHNQPATSSLTPEFQKLCISSLSAEKDRARYKIAERQDPQLYTPTRRRHSRLPLHSQTFEPFAQEQEGITPSTSPSESIGDEAETIPSYHSEHIAQSDAASQEVTLARRDSISFEDHPLMRLPCSPANFEQQVARHQAGQYDLYISYPPTVQPDPKIPQDENRKPPRLGNNKIVYGCNFVRRNAVSKAALRKGCHVADTVLVIASPLEDEALLKEEPKVLVNQMNDAVMVHAEDPPAFSTPSKTGGTNGSTDVAEVTPSLTPASAFTKSASPSPVPRALHIEDSVEALDKLEEELEAVNLGVLSPSRLARQARLAETDKGQRVGAEDAASKTKRPHSTLHSAAMRVKSTQSSPAGVEKSRSMSLGAEDRKKTDEVNSSNTALGTAATSKKRLSSLAPPKPLAKSTKPRTVPAFELPGEAVARRLKEQREARLSMQSESSKSSSQTTRTSTPQRTRSSRQLSRPTFELPGDAFSRRKREEREAKLRAQEEEEKKRREFKARPIRANLGQPTSVPRETLASRARQSKASEESTGKTGPSSKRLSFAATSSNVSVSPQSQTRGRGTSASTTSPSQASRATSVSAGSVTSGSGKRGSSISAEDAAQQKVRGREIFARDNRLASERMKERSEREALAKLAREQAAERSRLASREWAEKQRRKAAAATAMSSSGSGSGSA